MNSFDPDDEMIECKLCGEEYYHNRRYHLNNKGFCRECDEEIRDRRADDAFERRRDGEY